MRYDNLPIYHSAMQLCVYVETIVKSFEKYHKYTLGVDLRNYSKELLFMIHRVNALHDKKQALQSMTNKCEDLKMLVHLAKELQAFKSFKQFETMSKHTVGVCKQSQAWLNHFARVVK